ncbi:MAG: zinc-ribbon domain-containing protein [Sulfuricella sp.]|nr:zinc-ribbon domain-containing protein [Sulfuricella sp.]
MAHTTTCPACGTTFRVTAGQLLARQGDVRCGRCGKVFNAHQTLTLNYPPIPPEQPPAHAEPTSAITPPAMLVPEAPSPPLEVEPIGIVAEFAPPELPIPLPPGEVAPAPEREVEFEIGAPDQDVLADNPPADEPQSAPGQLVVEEFLVEYNDTAPAQAETLTRIAPVNDEAPPAEIEPTPEFSAEPEPVAPLAPEVPPESDPELDRLAAQLHAEAISAFTAPAEPQPLETANSAAAPLDPAPPPDVTPPPPKPKKPLPRWVMPLGSLALLAALVLQSAVHFRTELIAYNPTTRPLFEQLCGGLGCRVALPQNPDLLSIETSSLEAEPGRAGIVVLSAILRNRAAYAQSYPLFELTLTDYQDKLAARRIFQPQEYLPKDTDQKNGMPANEEVDVKLHLDLGELQAAGYRVYLFYSATTS